MLRSKLPVATSALAVAAVFLAACGGAAPAPQPIAQTQLSGDIAIDGSSTVYPITEAVAEEFGKTRPDVRITVGIAGTGGGFKKFCNGETDISDASRAIKDSEKEACAAAGIEYEEFQVGLDGLTVVVNPANTFAACLTIAQLKTIWDTGSTVANWNQVDPAFPDQPLTLYGPGTDSGTFDFFTEVVNGKAKQSRADFTASEDDNVLVQGVSGDANALGYFGLAYYIENQDKLTAVQIDGGKGCVAPSFDTVNQGVYAPLSRPLYVYVKKASLERPEVVEFVNYYISAASQLVDEVGYVAVPQDVYDAAVAKLAAYLK
ncbi:MAG: PstS family phosphate ABC transporter substrate-binding protein [Chloroflexi bacterium]|nr:PstS family phosphate ABC transporter substrate-binding protein [Chloroflexota bacterium]